MTEHVPITAFQANAFDSNTFQIFDVDIQGPVRHVSSAGHTPTAARSDIAKPRLVTAGGGKKFGG